MGKGEKIKEPLRLGWNRRNGFGRVIHVAGERSGFLP